MCLQMQSLTMNKNNKEQGKKIKDKMRIKQEHGNKEYDSRSLIFKKAPKTKYTEK